MFVKFGDAHRVDSAIDSVHTNMGVADGGVRTSEFQSGLLVDLERNRTCWL